MHKHDIDFLIFLHRYRFENKIKKGGFDRVIEELVNVQLPFGRFIHL